MSYGNTIDQRGTQEKPRRIDKMQSIGGENGVEFDYESKVWGGNPVRLSPTYLNALRLKYCLEDLEGVKGKVLEVGCGAGGMAKAIKAYRPDLDVYGCDISLRAIRAARENPGEVTFDIGDANDLPFRTRSFSAVVMFDVLEHLRHPRSAVEEIWQILEDGGFFHLFVPCEGGLNTLTGLLARAGWRDKEHYAGHIQLLTGSQVERVLKASGLRPVTKRWSGHLVYQLADAAYIAGLGIRGRNATASVEGYLETANPSVQAALLQIAKSGIAIASYYESRLLAWLPGWGIHILAQKEPVHE